MVATAFGHAKLGDTKAAITKSIKNYASFGDQQMVDGLKSVIHDDYRLVWYGGKDAPFIADQSAFLAQFAKKEWGGDKRKVKVESIEVFDGINATAKVILDGEKAQMRSLFTLIKVEDEWKVIGELVNATFK